MFDWIGFHVNARRVGKLCSYKVKSENCSSIDDMITKLGKRCDTFTN